MKDIGKAYDELEKRINGLSLAKGFRYLIGIRDEPLKSEILTDYTYKDLFYIYDNGSPRLGLIPRNISTEFYYWSRNTFRYRLESDLVNGILNEGWDRNQVKDCYERHVKDILEWYRMKMISDKIIISTSKIVEEVDMMKFFGKIFVKVLDEYIEM